MPHLNSWQIMPVPPPTLPSATGPRARLVERAPHMLGADVKAVDVVKLAVPGLGHHRQRPPIAARIGRPSAHAPSDHRVARDADAVGVGQHDRAFKLPGFLQPSRARHLAIAVKRKHRAESGDVQAVAPARQDRGHAGANLAPGVALDVADQRDLTHRHAGHVGDGVERPRRALERNAEIARARVAPGRSKRTARRPQ